MQKHPKGIFYGIIEKDEVIDLTICNPPFHESLEAAQVGTMRKLNNLNDKKVFLPTLNFGGQNGELWCPGGEKRFVQDMIHQSRQFASSCFWFSTLISKQANLNGVYETLKKTDAAAVVTIPMGQGNKISWIVAWSFLSKNQQKVWQETRWGG